MDEEALEFELQRARELRQRLQNQRRELAALSGSVAETEDKVASIHEGIAQGDSRIADQAAEVAKSSRAFAEHERQQERRFSEPTD
jgi:septal ring factor EnvC (AmiA/AmiB activator)